jgi:ariadne-1
MVKEETQQLKIHTKNCPQCQTPWWKNGGCNHFTCSCKHEFCWICLEPWSGHKGGFFNCEMKIAKSSKEGMEITEVINAKVVSFESEHEIARIKGYCEREMAHYILSTRVKKIRHDSERMVRLADKLPGVDVQVLDKVMAFLWECHVILRYCYVFLYIYAEHFIPDEENVDWTDQGN